MERRALFLRILYTINSSPQYILARSPSPIQISLIASTLNNGDSAIVGAPQFGTVSLKTCLDTICRSSPELTQDVRRDFSVYVLDPLESNSAPAPVNISNQPSTSQTSNDSYDQPRGVAVGLGLMSCALLADYKDSALVTGTRIKLGTGQEALEVIFALQQMTIMHNSLLPITFESRHEDIRPNADQPISLHNSTNKSDHTMPNHSGLTSSASTSTSYLPRSHYSADDATLATIASIQRRSHNKRIKAKLKKPARPSSINAGNSEADRLMLSEEVYVGPAKKKGRPANVIASGSKCKNLERSNHIKSKPSASVLVAPHEHFVTPNIALAAPDSFSRDASHHNPQHLKPTMRRSSQEPVNIPSPSTQSAPSSEDREASLLDILARVHASSTSDPYAQNAALLAVLSSIDSTSTAGSSASVEKTSSPALVDALRRLISIVSHPQQMPNLSNTLPTIPHNRTRSPDDEIVLLDKENVNPGAFRRRNERDMKLLESEPSGEPAIHESAPHRSLSVRSNGSLNTAAFAPTPETSGTGVRRKRTLSDFMDERETGKSKVLTKEKDWVGRRETHRSIYSSPAKRTDSSVQRHYHRLVSDGPQAHRRGTNSYYRTGIEFWSSPPRLIDENAKTNPKKDDSHEQPITIVGSTEHTKAAASSPIKSTSTQPQPRRKYIVPAWARTETSTQPRLSQEAQRALELAEERKREEKEINKKRVTKRAERGQRRPLFRSPSPSRRASRNVQQKSTDLTQVAHRPPPVTVASECPVFAMSSVIQDRVDAFISSSTFPSPPSPLSSTSSSALPPCTPPRNRHSNLFTPGVVGSSLFTPLPQNQGSNFPGPVHSPLGFDQRGASVVGLRKHGKSPLASATAKDGNDASAEESEEDLEEALNQELSMALEDLDTTPNALPTGSSEGTMCAETRSLKDNSPQTEASEVEFRTKQHWEGLPPSSPLPPTSPVSTPQDDEFDALSDDMELPAAASDVDPHPADSELSQTSCSLTDLSGSDREYLKESDFLSLFPLTSNSPTFGGGIDSALGQLTNRDMLFEEFNSRTTSVHDDFDIFNNDLLDFDFTEFWKSFKPLLQDQSDVGPPVNSDFFQSSKGQTPEMMNPDHIKLAEDVQALFSGCLT